MTSTDLVNKSPSRWRLVRQILEVQVKLLADGLKDLALGTLGIWIAIPGLIFGGPRQDRHLRALMRMGKRFDEWVNLYGMLDDPQSSSRSTPELGSQSKPESKRE